MYEEMRRTIEYCRWQSSWWRAQATARSDLSAELQDGVRAYALEHADLEDRFAFDLERRWEVVRRRAKSFMDSGFDVDADFDIRGGEPSSSTTPPPEPSQTVTLNLRELDELDADNDDDDF